MFLRPVWQRSQIGATGHQQPGAVGQEQRCGVGGSDVWWAWKVKLLSGPRAGQVGGKANSALHDRMAGWLGPVGWGLEAPAATIVGCSVGAVEIRIARRWVIAKANT